MLMRINYEIWWICNPWRVISYDVTIYFTLHGLWVLLQNRKAYGEGKIRALNFLELVKGEGNHCSTRIMGGRRKRSELMSCQEWKDKPEIWDILV